MHGVSRDGGGGGDADDGEQHDGPEVLPQMLDFDVDAGFKQQGGQDEDEDDFGGEELGVPDDGFDGNVKKINGESGENQGDRIRDFPPASQ